MKRIHLHIGKVTIDVARKKFRTHDSDPHEELMNRLLAAIEYVQNTTDEEVGHPFHGNQYTEVAGQGKPDEPKSPKPAKAISKGVKAGVHELLSSGHSFSKEELMTATGAKSEKVLSDAIAMLKNPKWAGPNGSLQIVKEGGMYKVVKPEAAEALKEANAAIEKAAAPDVPGLEEFANAPVKTAEPAPAPTAPPAVPAPPVNKGNIQSSIPATCAPMLSKPMEKAQADKLYQIHQTSSVEDLAQAIKQKDSWEQSDIIEFKQSKLNSMAQWSANTTGKEATAKQIENKLFEADKQLGSNLLFGMQPKTALEQWKKDTAKEKAGVFQKYHPGTAPEEPKPAPTPPAATKPVANALPDNAQQTLTAPSVLVPKTHKQINADDMGSDGSFNKDLLKAKSLLQVGHTDSLANKIAIEKALTNRLKDSPAWVAMKAQHDSKNQYSLERKMIAAWAGSSGDNDGTSCASQLAIRDAFNLSNVETKALHAVKHHGEDGVYKQAANALDIKIDTPEQLASFKAGLRDFALAQYHETQDHFKKLGLTEICLARGMKVPPPANAEHVNLKLQPASSFSTNYGTARNTFSGGQSVFLVKVPVSQVLSTYATGYGCTNEHEVVVLAHDDLQAVHLNASKAMNQNVAVEQAKQAFGHAPESKPADPVSATKAAWGMGTEPPNIKPVKAKAPSTPKMNGPDGQPIPKQKTALNTYAAKHGFPAVGDGLKGGYAKEALQYALSGNAEKVKGILNELNSKIGYSGSKKFLAGLLTKLGT